MEDEKNLPTSLETLDKEAIRLRGKQLTERVRQEVRLTESSFVEGSDDNMVLRTEIMEHLISDVPKLDSRERGLAYQYVLRALSDSEKADHWLTALPTLTIDHFQAHEPRQLNLLWRIMVWINLRLRWLGPLFGLIGASLPEPEESLRLAHWMRENRHWFRFVCGCSLLLGAVIDSLLWEIFMSKRPPNFSPPLTLIAISLLFVIVAIRAAPDSEYSVRGGRRAVIVYATQNVILSAICFAVSVLLHTSTPVNVLIFGALLVTSAWLFAAKLLPVLELFCDVTTLDMCGLRN